MGYTTIKASLNSFCKDERLKHKLNDVVLNVNKIAFEAYVFANLHILRLIECNKPIPKLNQSFFRLCCAQVSTLYQRKQKEEKDQEINATFEIYKASRPEGYTAPYRDNITKILDYLTIEMEVSTTNHLVLNFYKRFSRYLKAKYPNTTGEYRYSVCKGIYEERYEGNDPIVLEYRGKLNHKPPYEKYVKEDPSKILCVYNEILTFNLQDIQNKQRLFSLLPHKGGFQMSYITIDKSGLRDLIIEGKLLPMKDARKKTERNLEVPTITEFKDQIMKDPRPYWDFFFNIAQYEKKNKRKFTFFKTDGKTVSVVLETPGETKIPEETKTPSKRKKKEAIPTYNLEEYDTVIGIDPGYRYTFVGTNNQEETVRCSGAQYYHETGVNWVNSKQKRCYDRNPEFLAYKSNMPSPKTNNVTSLIQYLSFSLKGLDHALQLHLKNPFRKWKFTTFTKKQRVFASMCKKITKKRHKHDFSTKALVGFGDWSNPRDSIIKGHRRGPVKALKEELKKWCPVVSVNEFRTSKLCCRCHHQTAKTRHNGVEINSVLRCTNNECGIVIDRDINGSRNIFMIFNRMLRGESPPEAFCR